LRLFLTLEAASLTEGIACPTDGNENCDRLCTILALLTFNARCARRRQKEFACMF
jgi:hypothetical protein